MRKTSLLASTALVSAALAMGASSAQALTLGMGGYAEFWFGYADNDQSTDQAKVNNNLDIKHDMEIHFRAEEKLDSGITVGALLEMEAGAGGQETESDNSFGDSRFDESFGWIKTGWGQVNIGNNDLATGYVGGVSVVGPVGIIKSDAGDWLPGTYALNNTDVDLGIGDAQNITFFTPRVGGFQLIASYSPDDSDETISDFDQQETGAKLHQAFSGAVKFSRKFGGVGVGLGAGYTTIEAPDAAGAAVSDVNGWNAAADIRFGPARITAAYAFEDLAGSNDTFMGAGVRFALNKMNDVSLGWSDSERDRSAPGVDVDSQVITAGWERDMGKGFSFQASIFHAETESTDNSAENDGFGAVAGFELSF